MRAELPRQVAVMVAEYRTELARNGYDWGDEIQGGIKVLLRFADRCDVARWNAAFAAWQASGTLDQPVRVLLDALADPLPAGFAVVRDAGIELGARLPYAIAGQPLIYHVIVAGAQAELVDMPVSADRPDLEIGGRRARAVEPVPAARLRLVADAGSRWTVTDERGGAWFPGDAPRKHDATGQPFFYGNDVVLDVPATRLTVTVARGCEFAPRTAEVDVPAGAEVLVELEPARIYDAAARGWYGADLHVHLNYTGDLVWDPRDVSAIQQGEGLHLLNLVAGNYSTALVYDQEVVECFAGRDLPSSRPGALARGGVEYRNDLYGHFHVLGPTTAPKYYYTGHSRSDEPHDWPPNAMAAADYQSHGATVGYTHPLAVPIGRNGSLEEVFAPHRARSYEAREVVADAALGLVDSLDLMVGNIVGAEFLYHRLLGCGLRLAATAGTDVMLSRSRGRLTSNPPGWCRVYADLGGAAFTVPAWQDAVRAGRTFATNGPWLELDVGGCGPGDTLAGALAVPVQARAVGLGVLGVELVGPDGVLASVSAESASAESVELTGVLDLDRPCWLAAVARGGPHPLAGTRIPVYAHTSPVWVDVDGRSVARAADAVWCLDWLDRFEELARAAGHYRGQHQLDDLVDVLDRARAFYREITEGAA